MDDQLNSLVFYIKWLKAQGVTRAMIDEAENAPQVVTELMEQAPMSSLFRNMNWSGDAELLPAERLDIGRYLTQALNIVFTTGVEVGTPAPRSLFREYVDRECGSDEEREALCSDVDSFWSRLNSYMTPRNNRAYGLAVGRVQSGKTRNYIGLMFRAIDEGYNTVIILTSRSSQLAVQTHKRVEKWFGNDGLGVPNYRPLSRVRQNVDGMGNGVEWLGGHFSSNQVQVGIIIKNESGHLANVREWMDQIGNAARRGMRLLFIDDESDSATPNTNNISDPQINGPEDARRLINEVRISDRRGALQIADWMARIVSMDVNAAAVDRMCTYLRGTTRTRLMQLVQEVAEFKRLVGLDVCVDVGYQRYALSQLVYDLFNERAARRRPLNWTILRDFLSYAYGVRQERSRINRSICDLVGQSAEEPAALTFERMVYAGYTATPFANMLNEDPTKDPLCPDCIKSLTTNSRYFGLQRIFGGADGECNMNIVRSIADDECQAWLQPLQEDPANIEVGDAGTIRRVCNFGDAGEGADRRDVEWISLERAVKWAFCSASARRVVRLAGVHNADNAEIKYRWTTMLFNLSHLSNQETGVHVVQQRLIEGYIHHNLLPEHRNEFVRECMSVWAEETANFTGEDFAAACGGYGDYQDYPTADSVREGLGWFIENGGKVQVIQMNSAIGNLDQSDYNDPTCQDGDVLWIVCGGNAISRGLTLEGLTVSYYDRIKRSSAVDTITQMGRWFGYRSGYELLPRIWMTSETIREMKQICRVEESLHAELQNLFEVQEDNGNGVARHPSIREGLNATSIRYFGRRLSGRDTNGAEFAGATSRCVFETVYENQAQRGYDIVRQFCADRGNVFPVQWANPDDRHARHRLYWRDVASVEIAGFIRRLKENYIAGVSVFEAEGLLRELSDYPIPWNVVVGNPEGHGLVEVGGDFYDGYCCRNNPLRHEFGGVVQVGRKQTTGVALLARVPNRYIDAAREAMPNIPIGDIRQVEATYRLMAADANCEAWLLNPTLLIDFVNGEAGQILPQVSFYWHGHSQESFFRAVVNPSRPCVIAPVVEFLNEHGYASLVCLYHQFSEQLDNIGYEDFRTELNTACSQTNPSIALVESGMADEAHLTHTVYYSTAWMSNQAHSDNMSYGEIIGLDLYRRIIRNHWNWFTKPWGAHEIGPINHAPNNGIGYLNFSALDGAGYEKVMSYDFVNDVYGWMTFAQYYGQIDPGR